MEDFCSENVTLTSTSSSSSVVNELIESLLDEVVCIKDCDITAKGRRLSEGLTKERINKSSSSLDPIALIVDNFSSKDILVHLSMRDSHTTILQPFCLDQKVAGYCGHYAIHNMLCMIEVLTSAGQSTIEALQLIKEMKSSGAFWRRYWWNITQLLVRAHQENSWPWTEDYILKGDMERSFLRHILSSDHHVQHVGGQDRIIVLQYAYGHLQNTFIELFEIQEKVNRFRSTPGPAHISFILGITNHWLAVTVYKTGERCSCVDNHDDCNVAKATQTHERINMVILDSNNNDNIVLTDEDIIEKVSKSEKKRIAEKGKGYNEWKRSVYIQSHQDQRNFLIMLANCVGGTVDLRHEKAEIYIKDMLHSYNRHVTVPLNDSGGSSDCYIPFLLHWLEEHYPPKVLKNSLTPLASTSAKDRCLSLDTCCELKDWADMNCGQLEEFSLAGLTSVQSFCDVVSYVKQNLVVEKYGAS